MIEERADGFFLFRYSEKGEFAGDTWHPTLEDAFDQANAEFGVSSAVWIDIPTNVEDAFTAVSGDG